MAFSSIGDLSLHAQSIRNTTAIKDRLQVLSKELSTGKIDDLTKQLSGNMNFLLSLDREIAMLSDFRQAANEVSQTMSMMQNAFETLDTLRERQSSQSLAVTASTPEPIVDSAAKSARDSFSEMVSTLNRRIGSTSLFAGTQTDGAALADSETMLADIVATLPATATTADVQAAVDTWFDDPAGGFVTIGYIGGVTGAPERLVGQSETVNLVATAESEGVRSLLKSMALGAVADAASGAIDAETKAELVQISGVELVSASADFNGLRAQLGSAEAFVAEQIVEHDAQISSFQIMKNDITAADPYETAIRLQEVQQQLETQFAITARLSGLSLANYL